MMNIYTNGFRIACNESKSEVILHLLQNNPVFHADKTITSEEECVGEYVMSLSSAQALAQKLTELCTQEQ